VLLLWALAVALVLLLPRHTPQAGAPTVAAGPWPRPKGDPEGGTIYRLC